MTKSTKSIETEAAQATDNNFRILRDDELDLVCGGQKGKDHPNAVPFLKIELKQLTVSN
jgi:hypothetical protein